jgi:hypothetical protein
VRPDPFLRRGPIVRPAFVHSPLARAHRHAYAHRHESRWQASNPQGLAWADLVGRRRVQRSGRCGRRRILANHDARAARCGRAWLLRKRAEGAGKDSCPKTSKSCSSS